MYFIDVIRVDTYHALFIFLEYHDIKLLLFEAYILYYCPNGLIQVLDYCVCMVGSLVRR